MVATRLARLLACSLACFIHSARLVNPKRYNSDGDKDDDENIGEASTARRMADNSSDIDWATVGPPPDDGHGHDSHKGDLSTIGPQTVGVCWMLVVLSALLLSARLWVKFASRGRMWWDDHFLVASWVSLPPPVAVLTGRSL